MDSRIFIYATKLNMLKWSNMMYNKILIFTLENLKININLLLSGETLRFGHKHFMSSFVSEPVCEAMFLSQVITLDILKNLKVFQIYFTSIN